MVVLEVAEHVYVVATEPGATGVADIKMMGCITTMDVVSEGLGRAEALSTDLPGELATVTVGATAGDSIAKETAPTTPAIATPPPTIQPIGVRAFDGKTPGVTGASESVARILANAGSSGVAAADTASAGSWGMR